MAVSNTAGLSPQGINHNDQASPFSPQPSQQLHAQFVQTNILPPEILERLDKLVPGSAAAFLENASEESRVRRSNEERALSANIEAQKRQLDITEYQGKAVFRSDTLGQSLGFVTCALCIAGAIYLALNGAHAVAGALAAIPTAAIIKAFIKNPRLPIFKKEETQQ